MVERQVCFSVGHKVCVCVCGGSKSQPGEEVNLQWLSWMQTLKRDWLTGYAAIQLSMIVQTFHML